MPSYVADWWDQYGGECSELQEVARRIVSQCMSSSGCERNWSTFALVHTKLRNRLGYEKLHKLVFVHYNLKLRIQHFKNDMQSFQDMQINHDRDYDPCSIMIDVAMHDEGNPILDWLCSSRSESDPNLDEYDETMPDSPNPSRFVIEELGLGEEEVATFKKKIVGKSGKKRKYLKKKMLHLILNQNLISKVVPLMSSQRRAFLIAVKAMVSFLSFEWILLIVFCAIAEFFYQR